MLSTTAAAVLPELVQAPLVSLGPDILDPDHLIQRFGAAVLVGIVAIIFVETGLLFPILPGDSLLFTAGALVAQSAFPVDISIWALCGLMFLAAFLGDQTGFLIGRRLGPRVFNKPDSRFFKQSYIDQTYGYFDRYGGRTIIVARFVPIVRTYAPVAAGIGKMRYRHFVTYNAIGALLWGVGVTMLGYALGNVPFIKNNIESLLVLVVLISVIPIGIELWRSRRQRPTGEDGRDERYDEESERRDIERKAFE
ncbi:VTT domain-containing protein [Cellulomonas composti]|uniref:VTT domain-containing protein n=1 Tax=Cellulomonas composti TaxID=266130 RepID=A0A511J7C1_9CELL|nr:VTT domain-containing protein [Cellulomonas composti]GEL93874.1 hypothetical protein CCO02nite_05320 [Cellulomonas composti]